MWKSLPWLDERGGSTALVVFVISRAYALVRDDYFRLFAGFF
jgi:hypothetical protein